MYLLLKSLHLFFMISWFAGLFYLPRIYVNLAMTDGDEYKRLLIMANKLYKFMTPWGIGALICGLLMPITSLGFTQGWVHGKIFCGVLLLGYHHYCGRLLRDFQNNCNTRSHRWYRFFNELPVFVLMLAIYLAVFKPF